MGDDLHSQVGWQCVYGRGNWRLIFVSGLLPGLAMGVAKVGLRIVHAHVHGLSAGHASFCHGRDLSGLCASARTGIPGDCQLHEKQAGQRDKHCNQTAMAISGHGLSLRELRRYVLSPIGGKATRFIGLCLTPEGIL